MKKTINRALTALVLIVAASAPVHAYRGGHFHHGGHVGVGVFVGPGWGYPYYPYYPYYAAPPVVIQQQPETYVQQPAPRGEQDYWYFCKNPEGYYPYVKKCPEGWLRVVPSPPAGEEEE